MPDYTEHYNLKKPKKTENYDINDVTRDNADLIDKALYEKVDKLQGKGLSTNDFTDNYKKKVDSLKNYDDTEVKEDINTNTSRITQLEQKKDMLSQQMPWNTLQGESIHTEDSALWDENKLSLSGKLTETLADSTQEKSPSNPATINTATGVQKIRQFGKNLCRITSVTGYTYTDGIPTSVGDITINKFDTNNLTITSVANAYRIALTNIIQLLPNTTYTLSYTRTNNLTGGSARRYIYDYSETGGYSLINSLNSGDDGKMSYTFTTGESGAIALGWGYNNTASGSSSVISDIQIEKGSVATEYESCNSEDTTLDLGTTELCAIVDTNGNVVAQDRPVYRNGKWQWEKNIKKLVLNGTENWVDDTVSTVNHFRGKLDNLTLSKIRNACCDKFLNRTSEQHGEWEYIYVIGKACFINIANTKLAEVSLSGFKTWLSNNNVTVYYVLETPGYIDCTADQSAVLDKLYNNFKLQKGTNNIIVETDNGVGVNMELTYMQDNVLRHDKDITELKQAIVALGGVI